MSDDYRGVLKTIGHGKDPELKHQEGGYDAFKNPDGEELRYAVKGPGFVAFGPDQALIAAIARPGEKTLDKVLTPALAKQFLAGDVGVYVNASALVTRYSEQIDQARQTFIGALDQAGKQGGNAATMDTAKQLYSALFDSLKYADALTLSIDVGGEGLGLAGVLTAKPDTALAKAAAWAASGTAAELAGLPPDASFYMYMNMDASTVNQLQGMSLRMINPDGKLTPDQAKALAQMDEVGRIETAQSLTFGGGMRGINVTHVADPKKYIAAVLANIQALKGGEGPARIYKDVKIEADAENHRGLTLSHISVTLDLNKFAQLNPANPAAAASMKSMFGSDTMNAWVGTDGQRVFHVTAPNWNDARTQIDTFLKGNSGVGTLAGFKNVRSHLPDQANLEALVSVQGLVRMLASQLAATLNKPDLKAPDNLPREPVFFGVSLTPRPPSAYEFHLVVPSQVGPIFENSLLPLFQSITPPKQPE